MTLPKNIKFIRAAQIFFRISYGLFWFVLGLLIILAIIMPFSTELQNDFCRISIGFSLKNVPAEFVMAGTTYTTRIIRAGGYLQIMDGPLLFSYMELATFGLFLAAGILVMRQILLLIGRIRLGEFFVSKNILAMKKISIILIALWVLSVFTAWINSLMISHHFFSESLVHTGLLGRVDFSDLTLPLLLLILSEVFRAGISLKEEQDLTV